jgi:hypothetical protein
MNNPSNQPLQTQANRYPPLDEITAPTLATPAAAHYMNRRPQTLRTWACFDDGPIKPIRVNRRLAWRVADIKKVMGA